jgi:hypothetical protein
MPAQRIGAPHTAHWRLGAPGSKPLDGLAQKGHLFAEVAAGVAEREMNAQRDALAEGQSAVEALGDEVARFFAGKHQERALRIICFRTSSYPGIA